MITIIILTLSIALVICVVLLFLMRGDIRGLNQSLNKIKEADTNMRLTTTTFDKEICRLCNEMNDILEKQKKIVIENDNLNREFCQAITNISHDLRTPLTSVIGYIQMIKSEKTSAEKRQEYLQVVTYRLDALVVLMNKLFEYTKILENKNPLIIERVNVGNILQDTLSMFYYEFENKGFVVNIDMPESAVCFLGNSDSLRRVVQNLIQNVLTHGVEQFSLVVNEHENMIIFKNKVPDMEAIEIERLFDRFYTFDFSRSGKTSGLGLAIVKELIKSMDGQIAAYIEDEMLCICVTLKGGGS